MDLQDTMMAVLPALDDVYKLLAVAVAFYFPLALLACYVMDKSRRTHEQGPMTPQRPASGLPDD